MVIGTFAIAVAGVNRGRLTFSTDDGPDFCPPARHARFFHSGQSNTIPFILLNADVPADLNVKGMERAHLYVSIFRRDPS